MRLGPQRSTDTHRTRDDGFTLVELVVTVAIIGIIVSALAGVVIQYAKVSNSTQSRLNESTDQQFISTYWQQDVSALGRRDFVPAATNKLPSLSSMWRPGDGAAPGPVGAACKNPPGSLVAGFAWTEYQEGLPGDQAWLTSNLKTHAVVYSSVSAGAGQLKLMRTACNAGEAAKTHVLARHLTAVSAACDLGATCSGGTLPNTVTLTFTVDDTEFATNTSYETVLTAERRQND